MQITVEQTSASQELALARAKQELLKYDSYVVFLFQMTFRSP